MLSIDLTDHTLEGDLSPIVLVDMRIRAPLHTLAKLCDYMTGKGVPKDEQAAMRAAANDLKRQVADAIGAHEMVATHRDPALSTEATGQ